LRIAAEHGANALASDQLESACRLDADQSEAGRHFAFVLFPVGSRRPDRSQRSDCNDRCAGTHNANPDLEQRHCLRRPLLCRGWYEFITGIATGEVNPTNPQNAIINDIQLAPRNTRGNVVYRHNFYILQPLDFSKGNRKMMYEPPNRGGKTYQTLNNTPTGTNDPAALTDPAVLDDSFLWTRGYTTVWSGWENNLGKAFTTDPTDLTATASFQVEHNPDGSAITGPGYEYIVTGAATFGLNYPAASGNQGAPDAVLTHRIRLDDAAVVVPTSGWAYTDASHTSIKLTTGNFVNNDIYEFSYVAKDPTLRGSRIDLSPLTSAWTSSKSVGQPRARVT
jgi:hypothetical protein